MADRDPELSTLLEDVRTIKSILQNEDAPFPDVWKALYTAATAIAVVGLLQYFVPFFRDLDFDGRVLWLWMPAFLLVFPILLTILHRELRRSGRGVLVQSRVRHVLYARFIIPPGALLLMWVASRNPVFGVEGVAMVLIAMWQTVLEQIVPEGFRFVPLAFLSLGTLELLLNWRGPEVVLMDILLVSLAVVYAATLLRAHGRRSNGGR